VSKAPIPCARNDELRRQIEQLARELKDRSHEIASGSMTNRELHASGLFRGAIEQLRGEMSASMTEKREFTEAVLDYLRARGLIKDWLVAGSANRHDYGVELNSGRYAAIESKGCLDGNNTTIFERPPKADEFIIWSICQNPGADPRHNAWSGIHTRLSAEIISREQVVDGLIVWDFLCGTIGRPCPKLTTGSPRTSVATPGGDVALPPPCIYLFPRTVPNPRSNVNPPTHQLEAVEFLSVLHRAFSGVDAQLHHVSFEVANRGGELVRTTRISRGGVDVASSRPTAIQRK
jgi:hypothetical protein